jgi:DNA-directed RNA polymerase III subunit RPC1
LEEAWAPEYTYIGIIVDVEAIQKLQVGGFDITSYPDTLTESLLQLELTLDDIKWAIVAAKKLKIKQEAGLKLFP